MTPEQIKQLVRSEIAQQSSMSRFQITPSNRHTHNGNDAPYAIQPVLTFAGIIELCETPILLPSGWKVAKLGTGICQIAHNLGDIYQIAWTTSPIGAGGATLPVPIVTAGTSTATFPQANGVVEFDWFDANNGATAVDTSFYFIGVQVNNKNTTPTQYSVNPN